MLSLQTGEAKGLLKVPTDLAGLFLKSAQVHLALDWSSPIAFAEGDSAFCRSRRRVRDP